MQNLLSSNSRVQAPIIIVTIGDVTFGLYNKVLTNIQIFENNHQVIGVNYPNYLQSLSVKKINGQINQYSLRLEYPITQNDDPNMIDRILSKVSKSRKIRFTYGDATIPTFLYRDEEGIITNVTSTPDVVNSKITYNINAVSTAFGLNSSTQTFPAVYDKPSNIIRDLLKDTTTGLVDVFYGMHDQSVIDELNLIPSEDVEVEIPTQINITILDYLKYLVSCMTQSSNIGNPLDQRPTSYTLTFYDDINSVLDGPYFKITPITTSSPSSTSLGIYEVDVGYPSKDLIQGFSITDNQAYSILYDYNQSISNTNIVYRIGDNGEFEQIESPSYAISSELLKTTEYNKNWWANMTQFPIKAQLIIRGLLRPVILMSYIKVNVYYYGKKHTSSGLYIVTEQNDLIDTSGYKTTLSLTKIGGDTDDNQS